MLETTVLSGLSLLGRLAQISEASSRAGSAEIGLFQAVAIGIVQGLTEFLPISSTAHVKIVPVALGWGDPGVAFTAVIQLGSVAAILWYFWSDLSAVTVNTLRAAAARNFDSDEFRLGLGIVLGTVPIVICGVFIKLFVPGYDDSIVRSAAAIAIVSIVMALLLGLAEKLGQRKRGFASLGLGDGIGVGLAQTLALIPGVSRSGSTLTAGLFLGLKRETAARFSFLLGTPAILISGLVELKTLLETPSDSGLGPIAAGLIAALVSSYLSIVWLIEFLKRHSTWPFVWYRLAFGAVILIAIATRRLDNV
ncbi:undecaprenyl-diphosphate phosphatase [Romeria aff. gracilis LEGE 07310]|uniref:Undecaprenyl-diphosphatase n=1 Tax=Vasconcelosia minhoensis LEGE 07310 TaxID=915328 RepID=A0A8J7AKL0_9CYAN|nr:undecaprenyl-diphosphate phosphatase [Romeria gracilis]MBE9076875.1 undecaprenyl-diphosphate phosphatase [Romeria aff. gracilis LEGE 07310]